MAITRRNTLILLLTVVAAAGVIGGTGAFSTVEADRSVTVETEGDGAGNVILETNTADHESLTDDGADDTIGFDFDQVNVDAKTTYNGVLNVTVNDGSGDYNITVVSPDGMDVTFQGNGGSTVSNGGSTVEAGPGEANVADITLDISATSADSSEIDGDITFIVTNQ